MQEWHHLLDNHLLKAHCPIRADTLILYVYQEAFWTLCQVAFVQICANSMLCLFLHRVSGGV